MKKFFYYFLVMLAAVGAMPMLVSCETDDDPTSDSTLWEGELADAPYAADAVCYILAENAPIKSIEISGSGLYFVTPRRTYDYNYAPAIFRPVPAGSRASDGEPVKCGVFTKLSDNSFNLEGYGKCTFNPETGEITLEYIDGSKAVYKAYEDARIDSNILNDRLCRSWEFYAARAEYLDADKQVLGTHTYTPGEVQDEFIDNFTFTRSGRMYENDEGDWYGYSWRWMNAKSQIIMAVADNYEDGGGIFQVFFKNDTMTILMVEAYDSEEDLRENFESGSAGVPSGALYTRLYLECRPYKR